MPSAANHDPVTMRHIGAQEKLRIKGQAELSKIVIFRLETQYYSDNRSEKVVNVLSPNPVDHHQEASQHAKGRNH